MHGTPKSSTAAPHHPPHCQTVRVDQLRTRRADDFQQGFAHRFARLSHAVRAAYVERVPPQTLAIDRRG